MEFLDYKTIRVKTKGTICFLQLYRPDANNTINELLVEEVQHALDVCEQDINVVVIEGLPDVFCFGADFEEIADNVNTGVDTQMLNPETIYDLCLRLATGPFVTIAHVRGKVNAGGVAFVAACDIAIADDTAVFSLSELLFGLFPACVLPFLVRRAGFQKAHYLTLMTKPFSGSDALDWGLIDSLETNSEAAVRKHILRLKYLPKKAVFNYKQYMAKLYDNLYSTKPFAVEANRDMFTDPENLKDIHRFVETGNLPWQK